MMHLNAITTIIMELSTWTNAYSREVNYPQKDPYKSNDALGPQMVAINEIIMAISTSSNITTRKINAPLKDPSKSSNTKLHVYNFPIIDDFTSYNSHHNGIKYINKCGY